MRWYLSHRADPRALPLADRHYNRQKPGTPQFVPPGRCIVLLAGDPPKALWVSSWPYAEYVKHAWAGAWVCSCFRNEGAGLSSELIREAEAVTRSIWGDPPPFGMISFVDAKKTAPKDKPGWCYRKAGWKHVGFTKAGLWTFQRPAVDAPPAQRQATIEPLSDLMQRLGVSVDKLTRALR